MKHGHIIIISGSERSGKTTLAINLCAQLAKEKNHPLYIDITSGETFTFSKESGTEHIGKIDYSIDVLNDLKKAYSHLIIDFGADLTEASQRILATAHLILVTTETKSEKLSKTRQILNTFFSFIPKDIIYVILSRYSAKAQMNPAAIKKLLGSNILGAIIEDKSISAAAPLTPIIFSRADALATKYIAQISRIIQTKKILDKGHLIQERKQKIIPIRRNGVTQTKMRPSKKTQNVGMQSRFAKEELPRDPRTLLKLKVLKQLSSELNLKKLDTETGNDPKKIGLLRQKTKQAVDIIMEREKIFVGRRSDKEQFIKEILDEALALGPLEELLSDPEITEIMVNSKDQIYIEKNGKMTLSHLTFTSDAQLMGIIERIVAPLGRRIDEKTPHVDARLPDGSRVHAIIPPLALRGPTLTIRKFPEKNFTIEDLVSFGSLSDQMADFLRAAVESRLNCIVSGGTGSGKTTLLNVLSSFIPENERIITIEDSAELRLPQPHVIRLESRPPNIEGSGAVTIRDLVKNTLRMRPDRIVVGECRDGAALDMLQAMNTGHDGSLTTIHANSPRDCLSRLETLVMMAGMDLPSRAIREQIGSAVHLIVQQARLSDGSRKITNISEITGMEKDVITTAEIVVFKQEGIDHNGKVSGHFEFTGYVPKFVHDLEAKGLRAPKGFVTKKRVGK